jgi:hypothetical protein
MDVPDESLPEMVLCTGSFQGSLRTLIQHLRAQLPPGASHAKLRWCMTEECRSDLIEETPHPESLIGLCWANV